MLKNPAPASLFTPLVTEKKILEKLVDIFYEKISEKNKLETTETHTKIVDQKKNRTQTHTRVDTQEVNISAAPTDKKT